MELFQLEAFLAVVREGSFSAAAKALLRTQPAISQTIKKLEDEIGRPLFDRSSRRGVLTDAGLPVERRLKVVEKLLGDRAHNVTIQLLSLVVGTGRLRDLPGIVERLVRRAARAALGRRHRSLVVALSSDAEGRKLNARDRRKDKPTNVLSYPSGEKLFLGDIVLARQTVWREARQQKKSPAAHVSHLVVHGTLHLLGYDHETSEADAERMEALERRILARMGIADPY